MRIMHLVLSAIPALFPLQALTERATENNICKTIPQWYGALVDDDISDSTAIQDAIDSLPQVGGTVCFPPGRYRITTTISLGKRNNVHLLGAGGTTIDGNARYHTWHGTSQLETATDDAFILTANGGDGLIIENLTFLDLHTWTNDKPAAGAIWIFGDTYRPLIRNVMIKNFWAGRGLYLGSESAYVVKPQIEHYHARNVRVGIELVNAPGATIIGGHMGISDGSDLHAGVSTGLFMRASGGALVAGLAIDRYRRAVVLDQRSGGGGESGGNTLAVRIECGGPKNSGVDKNGIVIYHGGDNVITNAAFSSCEHGVWIDSDSDNYGNTILYSSFSLCTHNVTDNYAGAGEQTTIVDHRGRRQKFQTIADGDATPSVANGSHYKTTNTAATTITDLDDGETGQKITIVFNDCNTMVDFTATKLKGMTSDWSPCQYEQMSCIYDGAYWYCQ